MPAAGPARTVLRAVLRSYSLLFFSQHTGFATLLLLATFTNPLAGAAGLGAATLAVLGARLTGFSRELTDAGAYSFNSLLVGLALGTLYQPSGAWLVVLGVGAGLALLLSVALGGWLGRRGLPFLSLPFVGVMWLLGPGAGHWAGLVPNALGGPWLHDLYAASAPLASVAAGLATWGPPGLVGGYLRALSAVLLLHSAGAGLLVAAGLLWHSRIAFSLTVLAFLTAQALGALTGVPVGADAYDLGVNYLMAALAVGGVLLVPLPGAYGLAMLLVPLTGVLLAGMAAVLSRLGLPAYSLPFCTAALLTHYALLHRERAGRWLVLTPLQRFSPEANLYAYITRHRLAPPYYLPLTLPFLGEWTCAQGYADGGPTHQGAWAQALDFVVRDADGREHAGSGLLPTDYYCFDKPVLAPADGVVEEVVDHLDDNPIGQPNTRQNWGNTVVLRHAPGLYTQLSHLRQGSARVRVGDVVRRGDVLATCGNSGRSATPHLHLQVQTAPHVGARTLAYPLTAFLLASAAGAQLRRFTVPQAGDRVTAPVPSRLLSQALRLAPGTTFTVQEVGTAAPATRWEVSTDAWNQHYLQCARTGARAYFERDEVALTFTAFVGDERSALYLFYRAAYRLPLVPLDRPVRDLFPLTVVRNPLLRLVQDAVAPFVRFVQPAFTLRFGPAGARTLTLQSEAAVRVGRRGRLLQRTELCFRDGALAELVVVCPGQPPRQLRLRVG